MKMVEHKQVEILDPTFDIDSLSNRRLRKAARSLYINN